jgi:hypothetical protein
MASPASRPVYALLPGVVVLLLLMCSCASSPPPAAQQEAPAAPHICHPKASFVTFVSLGVPESERALDLITTDDYDYVLFAPARLMRLSRLQGQVKVEMVWGGKGESWKALALDPLDGSIWVATEEFVLVRVSPSLQVTRVPLQRVAGSGGFVHLVVARDAIYAAPTCADDGVWRIDRAGKILSSAFPSVHDPNQPEWLSMLCSRVRLDRDPEGNVVVWDWKERRLHRVDERGVWSPAADDGLFASLPAPALKGVDVGSRNEQWYFSGAAGLFLWKGKPVFLGAGTIRTRGAATVLLVPAAGGARELIENCHGASLSRVAATANRYAALIGTGIVLGDMATAPDLP